ncbi:hypothetical protein SVIO_100420 [Streptomyces violaceusniger]|uniref:MaoC-like domain-containing protein n=1 Tax=Streptomyces violaceusniger TaxID=68280 RepID=A0A4D4LNE1_STRVO|nr:hypothetical protein SVIO_100420 [Streptomyces violaceusniger]
MSAHTGQPVQPVEFTPHAVTLLRFGAVTRNAHRIHYDTGFARSEGLDGPVVMAQLHGCLMHRAAMTFAGRADGSWRSHGRTGHRPWPGSGSW